MLLAKRLAFLVQAGVPVVECIEMVGAQSRGAPRRLLTGVARDVARGSSLYASFRGQRGLFGNFGLNLIRIGEASGTLGQNLLYVSDELRKRHALKRKIMGALGYPLLIAFTTLALTSMLTVFIFPKIMPVFIGLHVDLPLTTRVLLAVSNYLRAWGVVTLAAALLCIGLFILVRRQSARVRYVGDAAILKLPLVGRLMRTYYAATFCRTSALMLGSGMPLVEALALGAETAGNRVYARAYAQAARRTAQGEKLSLSLSRGALFPETLTHLVAVGEVSGNLAATLAYLAELYEGEVDELAKNFSSSLEPALMITMGLIVGLVAVSIITPIYDITQHLTPR